MPWCETCDRYLAPNALTQDGECPECGTQSEIEQSTQNKKGKKGTKKRKFKISKIPWHLWILIVVLGIYLSWRIVQGITALFS